MTTSFSMKEIAWKRILIFMVLIFVPNLLIMRVEIAGPVNHFLGLATAIDLVIVLPLVLYFFGFRKRAPILALFAFMFWGLILANLLIPNEANGYLSYFNYSVIALEALVITMELFILVTILRKIPSLIKNFKKEQSIHYHFLLSFTTAIQHTISFKKSSFNYYFVFWRQILLPFTIVYSLGEKSHQF